MFDKFKPISKNKLFTLLKLYKQSYHIKNKSVTGKSIRKEKYYRQTFLIIKVPWTYLKEENAKKIKIKNVCLLEALISNLKIKLYFVYFLKREKISSNCLDPIIRWTLSNDLK